MKEMQFTVERGGPLLPFLLEHVKGSRNHVKSLLARGQVQVDGAAVRRHDHPLAPGQRVSVLAQGAEARRAPSRCSMRTGASWSLTSPPAC